MTPVSPQPSPAGESAAALPEGAVPPARHPGAPAPGEPIVSHYDDCFGCGSSPSHGLHLQPRAGEGADVTAEFTVRPEHQGGPGLAHGGVLASALDETLGALGWMLQKIAVTGRLETDYLQPVPVGSVLHLRAAVEGVEGRKIHCTATGRIGGPDGPVAVRGKALFIEVKVDHFLENGRDEEIRAAMDDPEQVRLAEELGGGR